jgi:hypothetical protein
VNPRPLRLISVLLAGVSGCLTAGLPDGGVPGDGDADVTVTLGTGQLEYEDLARPDGPIELVYGPQGGYHLWGRARIRGFAPDVEVSFTVTRAETGAVLHSPRPARRWFEDGVRRGLRPLGGGEFVTDAEVMVLDLACATDLVGSRVRIQLLVRERASGRTASDERVTTVVDEVPSPACGGAAP